MQPHLHRLKNGLRLITTPNKGTEAITVLVLTGAGSRYETKEINGISHFLEHMFFKGAKKYKSAAEVSSAIDGVGGDFNAFTGKEYAGYYVKLAAHQKEIAFDVISDMLLYASFKAEEIKKERNVILEEYNMYQDTPMYQVGWDFERLLFGDQPLGWDEIGTKELIRTITHDDFVRYKKALYTPDNTMISIAGVFDDKEIVALTQRYFDFSQAAKQYEFLPYQPRKKDKRVVIQHKKTEQGHMILGAEGLPARHPDVYALKVLGALLGGYMSSRMFLRVREEKGLSYYIRTNAEDYTDTGVFSTSAGVDLKRVDEATEAIVHEYKLVTEEIVHAEELTRAKEFLKGKIILRLEDSEELAHLFGKQALLYPEIHDVPHILRSIDRVTAEDVHRVAKTLLLPEKLHLALIGPYENESHFESLLHY
ncbi:insulinase family protein [Candidatus Peregrinibacteria bacterium]|nr:insulinase family protein [Candidatus Peregrinibacteria bacterium]